MDMPPEPPAEGVLIETARREAGLSVREAARRAGISEGWWRQVVKGYQSLSGGAIGAVRDVPAETIAKMASATGVTPAQLTEAGREDAARMLEARQHRDAAGAADALAVTRTTSPRPAPVPRREVSNSSEDPGLPGYRQQVLREVYEAIGLLPRLGPGELPRPDELPGTEDALLGLPGALMFTEDYEVRAWDNPRISLWGKIDSIARARLVWDKAVAEERRRAGTGLVESNYPLVPVAGTASRASS
jgi:transcriptional regulator with XRE-family HTH domain